MKNLVIAFGALLFASTSMAAGYKCEGKGKAQVFIASFTNTPSELKIVTTRGPEAMTLTRDAGGKPGMVRYSLDEEYGDDSGTFGFMTSFSIPTAVANSRTPVASTFSAVYSLVSSDSAGHEERFDITLKCKAAR